MILPDDPEATSYYDALTDKCRIEWRQILVSGTNESRLLLLQDLLSRVRDDAEVVCSINLLSGIITNLICGDDDEISNQASMLYEACVINCPPGVVFPSATCQTRGRFVLALPTLPLRLNPVINQSPNIPHIVWHSSIVLARWLHLQQTSIWFHDNFGNHGRVLELGGGTCIAGLTYAALHPNFEVVLSDIDEDAMKNAEYNVSRLCRLQYCSSSCVTTTVLDWNHDEEFHRSHGAMFDLLLGADVVHEHWMATSLWGAISRYLKSGGVAVIVNPVPNSREGADVFQELLAFAGRQPEWCIIKSRVSNPELCVNVEDVTNDIPLDFYTISRISDSGVFLDCTQCHSSV